MLGIGLLWYFNIIYAFKSMQASEFWHFYWVNMQIFQNFQKKFFSSQLFPYA
jgi:hypothetical protein